MNTTNKTKSVSERINAIPTSNKLMKFLFYSFAIFIFIIAIYFYKTVISYLVLSVLFAVLFNPLVVLIEKVGIKRGVAVFIFFIILGINLVLIGNVFIPNLIKQLTSFATAYTNFIYQTNLDYNQLPYIANFQNIYEKIQEFLPFIDFESMADRFFERTAEWIEKIPNFLVSFSGSLVKVFTYFLAIPIVTFFLLKDHILLKKYFYSIVPNKYFEITVIIMDKIKETIGTYFRAVITEMCIISTLFSIALSILGVKFAVLLGISYGILNAIQYVGPVIGFTIAGLTVILTGGSTSLLITTLIVMFILNSFENMVIYPLVMGNKTKIHPAVIILSVLAGGFTLGFIGIILAVPTVFLLSTVIKLLYKSLKQFEMI